MGKITSNNDLISSVLLQNAPCWDSRGAMAHPPRNPKVGAAVRSLRIAGGLTQADLAGMVNIAPETLSRIETDRATGVSVSLLKRLASALDVPLADLFKEPLRPNRSALRPAERTLFALVSSMEESEVRDLVRLVRLALRLGRRPARPRTR
jgi:transcriptional regulator with XRE-family HTH domain